MSEINSVDMRYFQRVQPNVLDFDDLNNYPQDFQMAVDNEGVIQDNHQKHNDHQNYNDHNKKLLTILGSTRLTKTITKGRPKKKQIQQQEFQEMISQHQQTIFGLSLWFAYKCLSKDYKKYSKCGFLHKNVAPSGNFYLEIGEAIRKNKLLSKDQYRQIVKQQCERNKSLNKFISRLLWIGPTMVVDELIFLISYFLCQNKQNIQRYKTIQTVEGNQLNQIQQNTKSFIIQQFDVIYEKLVYTTFRCPRLKFTQSGIQNIKNQFLVFTKVFLVSTILAICQFSDNPYFSTYYCWDYEQQDDLLAKLQKTKKEKKNQKKEEKQNKKRVKQIQKEQKILQLVEQKRQLQLKEEIGLQKDNGLMTDGVYQQLNINNEYHQQQIQYQNQFYVYGYTYYNPYFNL